MNDNAILEIASLPATPGSLPAQRGARSRASVTLLHAVSRVSAILGEAIDFESAVMECLRLVGEATGVDRAYVFEGSPHPDSGEIAMSQRVEWCRPGLAAQAESPVVRDNPLASASRRWHRLLASGEPVCAQTEELSPEELALLEGQGIRALLVVPIFVDGELWGSIGFDDCTHGDAWGTDEIDVLMCLASGLGGLLMRLRAMRALKKSEAFHRSIVENSRDVIFALDRRGCFSYVSPAWEEVYGTPPATAIGVPFTAIIHPDDIARCWERLHHRMQFPDDVETLDYRVRAIDGTYRNSSTRASIVQSDEADDVYVVGVAIDVTDRQRREDELARLAEELQSTNAELAQARDAALAASETKGRFLATMSHELRTPLNGVIGTTSLLLSLDLSDDARQLIRTVQASGETLVRVINDILDFSKAEADRVEIELTPVDLSALIGDVVALYRGHAQSRGVGLAVEGPSGPAGVLADPVRLKQVLGNLVGNALKFTHEGEVRIEWSLRRTGTEVSLALDVVDTGIGIPSDRLATIFEPFDQGDVSIQRRFGGTGLGLAISKRLVDLMGGTLSVRSDAEGSTFSVNVRFTAVEVAAPASENRPETTRLNLRILLAEDNPVNVMVATRILNLLGCQVDIASDGLEAISLALEGEYDVIMMDVQMPKCDGLEACRAIRAAEARFGGHRRIMALTANAMAENRQECEAAGMDDFLPKPFTLNDVRARLEAITFETKMAA
ncbi:MAG: ATP-binding protein [Fimbriimonas sp.]